MQNDFQDSGWSNEIVEPILGKGLQGGGRYKKVKIVSEVLI